ncbi:hypothetical protein BU24DRAFT_22898 [Aaosphaeria arxii CBS 175.79]|uniref:Uncharacterized protein n=1 Tax=Aaosphaeria arxii CBS 175.79 TaxID=1450172 RepID=A0A6A5Y7S9_9PLEO|nr:uncharacterized protein BU24DRAFT_22898 [Aaosphaeria arxii CBS 175.79]KAF2021568.1 hypothetical protein BU24DRAFT_22898 [Aaosphaeria arxii CBS 175.79]
MTVGRFGSVSLVFASSLVHGQSPRQCFFHAAFFRHDIRGRLHKTASWPGAFAIPLHIKYTNRIPQYMSFCAIQIY